MEFSSLNEDRPTGGENFLAVLSIDGGGVRGLIPAIILAFLESELQKLCGPDARIADYFDVVAGSSTGGLLIGMLTAPNENKPNVPIFSAAELKDFYLKHSPHIFSQKRWRSLKRCFVGPKYNGRYLRDLVKRTLKDTKLSETLTKVVIPTYDIKDNRPIIFSSFQVGGDPLLNANLSDICIATSAAPTYLPSHYFKTQTQGAEERTKEYHLIDGGIIANNPTSLGVKEIIESTATSSSSTPKRVLIISLGTGSPKNKAKLDARKTAKWGMFRWLHPLINMLHCGREQMSEPSLSLLSSLCEVDYLRIQDDTLSGSLTSVDIATKKNLKRLVEIGEGLLDKPVTKVNLQTGAQESCTSETNRQALIRFVKLLVENRKNNSTNHPLLASSMTAQNGDVGSRKNAQILTGEYLSLP